LEQQFVEHAEQTNNVLWTFSPDMEDLIFINSAFEDLYGISTDRFRDNPLCFLEATHPEDRLHVEEAVNRLQDGQPVDIEHRVNGKKDHQRWVQVQAQPIYDDNDEVTRIVGLITDITEQKERENQLRQFKQAVESTGQPFYFTDCDGVIEYVNPAFEETTGYSAEEVIGKTPKILQSGAHDQSFYETMWETLLDGKTWHGELFNQRKDGEQIVVEQTIAPVTDETGQINHFVAVSNDITEQKTRAQKRKQVIKRMTDGVFEVDADWRCTLISDHAQTVLGVSESELLGENLWDVFGNAQETTFETEYREVMETREPTSFVEHYEEFDRWFDVQVYPNDDGGIAVYFQDVTERKERERYLELLDRVLRHNLRNDINVIRGQAEIIHNQSMNGIGESAQKIVKKSDNLIQLAEKERVLVDILQEQPEVIDVVVRPFLKTIVTKMESTYPHATLHLECPDEITTTASAKFSKAVEELISNAIIHSKSDDPVIEITVRSTPTGVSIAIVDDAPPIPRMEQNVLLQESEPTSLYHGGGLGLSLVRVLTSRSNGRIELDRVDAGGNRIELTLPS
jgi:PAS domain S-box-containing protein